MSGGHQKSSTGGITKLVIVGLLFAGVVVIHRIASRDGEALDPRALLALGFVILASYTFGKLVERVSLPHITGYLVAGVLLGPSIASTLPAQAAWLGLPDGLLSDAVITQLEPLETLAVALIALTAGGELKIESLRKSLVAILGVLTGQVTIVIGVSVAFMIAVSGLVPPLPALPGIGDLDWTTAAALGAVLGSVSIATSPAATMAVIDDLKARGPMSTTVLSTVVLKDVIVVVCFAVLSTLAVQQLGIGSAEGNLGLDLLQHIGGALVLGGLVGALMALYLRNIGAEVLLFLVASVFVTAFIAERLDVEVIVVFLTAGFVVANFSREGEQMLSSVHTLSLPVYVVFFTLAGAHLDLVKLYQMAGFAVALFLARVAAIYMGTRLGASIGRASPAMQKHGWMGFVSQAGVAFTLAREIETGLGEAGRALSTLVIAGIALNEVFGPILLKVGLGAAKEGHAHEIESEPDKSLDEPPVSASVEETAGLNAWPEPKRAADAWGDALESESSELNRTVRELQLDLAHVSTDVADEPLALFREQALGYIREIRREFLRHHRRITVQALDNTTELDASEALRLEQAELAEKWRATVLSRAARVGQTPGWQAAPIAAAVEAITDGLPETITAPYEAATFVTRSGDGVGTRIGRAWLRARRLGRRLLGEEMAPRTIQLRALARYHLWGRLPERLEPVAALHAQAERHLVARTRSIFLGLVLAYDELAQETEADKRGRKEAQAETSRPGRHDAAANQNPIMLGLDERLKEVRQGVDEELVLAVQEVDRIAEDLAIRTSLAIGTCLRDLKNDLPHVGGPELPMWRRAASRQYKKREDSMEWLASGTQAARRTSAGTYNRLALEMELHALEGRVKDALEQHASALGRDVRGRAYLQVERVQSAIVNAQETLQEVLSWGEPALQLSERIRELADPLVRVAAEASRSASMLGAQLSNEDSVAPVLDALTRSAQTLTIRYEIPAGPIPRAEHRLPPAVGTVEVPFREWIVTRIDTALAPRLLASTREVAQKMDPLAHALSELERRIAFNVELAVNELSVVEETESAPPSETLNLVRDMVGGTLERNIELFSGFAETSEPWGEDVRAAVREAVLGSLDELRGSLVDGEVGRVRSQMVRHVQGQRIVRLATDLRRAIARSWNILTRATLEAFGEERIDRWRERLGVPAPPTSHAIGEGSFHAPEPDSSIPMVYRRLFSAQALEAGDILTGRDEALNRALSQLEGKADELRAVAVVGPDGVGKSAFVNAVMRAKRWPKVRELALDEPATVEQVASLFEQNSEGHLIVISGLHWLRSIRPGGFEPLRRFVEGVLDDQGRNAFLVRADALVWAQCKEVAPLADAFPRLVELGPLSPEALSAAVLARHTVSGHGLVFTSGTAPESRLEELAHRATSPLSRPRQSFFRALHTASGGLLRDALRLWLASVDSVDEPSDFVNLGPVPTPAIYTLRRLGDDELLTLYQVARQGWMNAAVCGSLFRTDRTTATARLMALRHLGILERRGDVFRVAVHLRGSVLRLLSERGFVA